MTKFIYLIFLKISLFTSLCIEEKNHCTKCNPISKLCVKCDKDIYVPDQNGGCEYSHKCILGKNNCVDVMKMKVYAQNV